MKLLISLGIGLLTVTSTQIIAQSIETDPRIVNGIHSDQPFTTAAVLVGSDPDSAQSWCTGTLIGCSTVLTAAHCVEDYPNYQTFVYLQHAGVFAVSSIASHPTYNFPVADVAVLKLENPVSGITPIGINDIQSVPAGTAGTIAGFGRSGGQNYDYGLKRTGEVVTGACRNGISNTTSVCWQFSNPVGNPGEDSNSCNGDSGGPLYTTLDDQTVVAGITSGGTNSSCYPNDFSYDANVYHYADWIKNQAGGDIGQASCGELPAVGGDNVAVTLVVDSVGSAPNNLDSHTVPVPADAGTLRVALNGVDDGVSDFDLAVSSPSFSPMPPIAGCVEDGAGQVAFCEFPNPSEGEWSIEVSRVSGAGSYQLVSSVFDGGPVLPLDRVELRLTSSDPVVSPGEYLPYRFSIRNLDNANSQEAIVSLTLSTPSRDRIIFSDRALNLAPNTSRSANRRLSLPNQVPLGTYFLTLAAQSPSGTPLDSVELQFSVE